MIDRLIMLIIAISALVGAFFSTFPLLTFVLGGLFALAAMVVVME